MHQLIHHFKQKGGFADAGVAPDQRNAARHKTAAHHAVKFLHAGNKARDFLSLHIVEIKHFRGAHQALVTSVTKASRRPRFNHKLFERIPLAAVRAASGPFSRCAAALGAHPFNFLFLSRHICLI